MTNKDGFLNVYNFIPFPEKKSKRYEDEDRHTGVIEYTITTKTPLFIPNTSNQDAYTSDIDKEKRCYDFFSYEELNGKTDYSKAYSPVIPGSELRGMTRNLYEMLTDSCMAVLNGQERPVKRTAENFKAGLIKKDESGNYTLVDAEDCIYREGNDKIGKTYESSDIEEGEKVYFFKKNRSGKNVSPLVTECTKKRDQQHPDSGYVIKGMASPKMEGKKDNNNKKHNAHIFIPKSNKVIQNLTKSDLEGLTLVLKDYQAQPQADENSYKEYSKNYSIFQKEDGENYFPVYYSQVPSNGGKLLYLAPAKITKELSHATIGKLAGDMNPCEKKEDRCPACDLFGMVGKNNEEAMGTRIRFTDAIPADLKENEKYYMNPVRLQELSGPKLGNTEFYLEQPQGADLWTYDYYTKDGKEILKEGKLRGRKFYWNQPDVVLPQGVKESERNFTARPVKRGITFAGKLYYDGISQKQLDQLLWILNGGTKSGEENDIVYKVGGGKPLGLGSVEFQVTEIKERILKESNGQLIYDIEVQKSPIVVKNYETNGFNMKSKKAIFNMLAYEKLKGYTISYPMTEKQKAEYNQGAGLEEGFSWFTENHCFYRVKNGTREIVKMAQKRTAHGIKETLPSADEIITMPYLGNEKGGKPAGNASHNQPRPTGNFANDNKKMVGKVSGFHESGKKLSLQFPDGRKVWIHQAVFFKKLGRIQIKDKFPIGTMIEIENLGKDENGYQQYQYIGIAKEN